MPWYTNQKFCQLCKVFNGKKKKIHSFHSLKEFELENSTEFLILWISEYRPFKEHGSGNLPSSRLIEQVSWSTILASQVKLEKSETVELHRQQSDGLETRSALRVLQKLFSMVSFLQLWRPRSKWTSRQPQALRGLDSSYSLGHLLGDSYLFHH